MLYQKRKRKKRENGGFRQSTPGRCVRNEVNLCVCADFITKL